MTKPTMHSASLFKPGRLLLMPHLFVALLILALACNNAMAAGALAIDEAKGDQYGWAINFPTYQEAEQNVLQECGEGCSIVLWVSDSCAAYAADQQVNSTVIGWSQGFPNADEARNRALAECRNRSDTGSQCIVRVWGCDTETMESKSAPGASGTVLASSPAHPERAQTSGLPAEVTGEELCSVKQDTSVCWRELENQPGCYLWMATDILTAQAVTWSGACIDGLVAGTGTLNGRIDEGELRISYTATGQVQRGKAHGQWVINADVDTGASSSQQLWKGSFVDGNPYNKWVSTGSDGYITDFIYDEHGESIDIIFYDEHGKRLDM